MQCIAAEDGVVHIGHTFTPEWSEDPEACGGVLFFSSSCWNVVEKRHIEEYKLAMWVTIDGVRVLHKTRKADGLDEAREWLQEMIEDGFPEGKWFIVKDVIETSSIEVK